MRDTQITTNMRANFKMGRPMARGSIHGPTGKSMMGNGKMESKRAMGYGRDCFGDSYIGEWKNSKADGYGCTSGRMEIDMRGSGGTALKHG